MSKSLLLCLTQKNITVPYMFETTGIRVYSFEEALFHCYYNWMHSLDEIFTDGFSDWVKDVLGLDYLAGKVRELSAVSDISERLVGFLTLVDYFSNSQIDSLKLELREWADRLEWERLKVKGDYHFGKGNFERACEQYNLALAKEENAVLLNNIGLCYLKLRKPEVAYDYFRRSYEMAEDNQDIIFNFSECAVFNHDFITAEGLIEKISDKENVFYLRGILEREKKNYTESINNFTKAFEQSDNEDYIYYICDVCIKVKMYTEALRVLGNIINKDSRYFLRLSEVYMMDKNLEKAIEVTAEGLEIYPSDIGLLSAKAKYHRMSKDLTAAEKSIKLALDVDDSDAGVLFELAKIKEAQGKTKDFRASLRNILEKFKSGYREYFY